MMVELDYRCCTIVAAMKRSPNKEPVSQSAQKMAAQFPAACFSTIRAGGRAIEADQKCIQLKPLIIKAVRACYDFIGFGWRLPFMISQQFGKPLSDVQQFWPPPRSMRVPSPLSIQAQILATAKTPAEPLEAQSGLNRAYRYGGRGAEISLPQCKPFPRLAASASFQSTSLSPHLAISVVSCASRFATTSLSFFSSSSSVPSSLSLLGKSFGALTVICNSTSFMAVITASAY